MEKWLSFFTVNTHEVQNISYYDIFAFIFFGLVIQAHMSDFILSLFCTQATYALHMAWWFYFSKFIDFADSIFFVLRKKTNQLSTLHIIHHSTMPIFSWFGPKVGIISQYCSGYLKCTMSCYAAILLVVQSL